MILMYTEPSQLPDILKGYPEGQQEPTCRALSKTQSPHQGSLPSGPIPSLQVGLSDM